MKSLKSIICFKVLMLSTAMLFVMASSSAQSLDTLTKANQLKHQIDNILNNEIAAGKIPGAVIEIKKDGRVIYRQAYGYAQKFDYNHQPLPVPDSMTTQTLFDLASLTKVVGTTTSIMLLVDRGQLSVEDLVGKYITAFNKGDKAAITIRHLLTHTAGLLEWYPMFYRAHNKQETFKLIGELPLKYPVGAQRRYSDLGFTVLGEIVEKISGQSLDKFEEQNIFIPLGMIHTLYNPLTKNKNLKIAATSFGNPYEKRMVYDASLGYQFKEITPTAWDGWRHYVVKGEVNDGNTWYAEHGVAGAAGLFSTADDVQKLVDMLQNKGIADGKQFISAKTIDLFLTKDKFSNGLGWMMDPANSFMKNGPEGTFGHTGFTGTSITVVPAQNASIILLINRQQMGLLPSGEYYNVNGIRAKVFEAVMAYCK